MRRGGTSAPLKDGGELGCCLVYGLLFGSCHLGPTLVVDGGRFGDVADFPYQGRGVVQEEVDEGGDLGSGLQFFNRHVDEQGPGER